MEEKLSHLEMQILREIAGLEPPSAWGAWVGEVLGFLNEAGYITRGCGDGLSGVLTEKGHKALKNAG